MSDEADRNCPQCRITGPRDYAEPHDRPDGTRCIFLRVFTVTYTDDDVRDGDIVGREEKTDEELHDCLPDTWDLDDGHTPASLAARYLRDGGVTDPSSTPGWHPGMWYSTTDTAFTMANGFEKRDISAHLYGFTPDEEHEVNRLLNAA